MQATDLALEHLLRAVGDPVADVRHIGPRDPQFRRAQVIRAAAAVLAKTPDTLPVIARVLRETDHVTATPHARAHLHAAEAWLRGDPVDAAERYAAILAAWPHDLLALRLAQSCYFFVDWLDRLCAVVDDVVPAWSPDDHGIQLLFAMASFAHAENGDAEFAEALGREALARDSACPMGVHAVAHAIAESGRPREGARWMREQRAQWATDSRMRTHNAWHLALFDVDDGNVASALGILDAWLLPACAGSALEACDAAALLWRLTEEGVDDDGRWTTLSDAFERTVAPGFWPYVDLHAGLAHQAAGQTLRARRLSRAIDVRALEGDYAGWRARHVTRPGLQALRAWADGRHDEAATLFASVEPLLGYAGGSRPQLELFADIARDAARRQSAHADAAHAAPETASYHAQRASSLTAPRKAA